MAKFAQMSSKKLNALLNDENTSAEDKAEIQEVLNKRQAAMAGSEQSAGGGLSPEEQAAVNSAEAEANPDGTAQPTKPKAAKLRMTDEERTALAESLRQTAVNHRCEVVPFNCLEWVPGTVVAIIEEKKVNKVMFAVLTDDGKRIIKSHDSQLIRISDEVVEAKKKQRASNKTKKLDENGNPIEADNTPWTDEEIEAAVKEVIENVGKRVSFPEAGKYGAVEEGAATVTGRIVSLVPNKRTKTILYRILIDTENKDERKFAHKVPTSNGFVISDMDEEGEELNKKFTEHRYREVVEKVILNPDEAMHVAEASLNKAKESLNKATELVAKRQAAFDAAKEAYDKWIAEGGQPSQPAEESTEEPAGGADNSDLM